MKTIAVCNTNLKELYPKNSYYEVVLCGENITLGVLDDIEQNSTSRLTDDKILVKIQAFSCNYRDKALMLFWSNMCNRLDREHKYFYTPFGSEFVGEVVEVGKNVKSLKIGDRVIPDGSFPYKENGKLGGLPTNYASKRMQYFTEYQVVKIPDVIPDEIAAVFTIASQTVYSMLRRLNLTEKSTVLVTAATSNTSLAAINALVSRGINPYVITSNRHFEKQLVNIGVRRVIPYSALNQDQINDYLNNIELDVVIDPFCDIYFPQLVHYMGYEGKYIFCGFYNQASQFDPIKQQNDYTLKIISRCIAKNISVIGNCLGTRADLQHALTDYEKGCYNIIIDSIYTEDNILLFFKKTFHDIPRFGKVVYKYSR